MGSNISHRTGSKGGGTPAPRGTGVWVDLVRACDTALASVMVSPVDSCIRAAGTGKLRTSAGQHRHGSTRPHRITKPVAW